MLALLLSWTALAGEAEIGVVVEPLIAIDVAKETEGEDWIEGLTWVRVRARGGTDASRWFLGVDGEHHIRHGADTEGIWEASVAESGWKGSVGPAHLRVGMLIERWGKLDLLGVVDVLNPRDLRAGPLATLEALREPVPMLTTQWGSGSLRLETVLTPFAGADRAGFIGGDWALLRQDMVQDTLAAAQEWDGGGALLMADPLASLERSLANARPSTVRALGDSLSGSGRPEALGSSAEGAIRLELERPGLDLALMGASLISRRPATTLDPAWRAVLEQETWPALDQMDTLMEAEPLTLRWPRSWMAGMEAATVLGPIGFRTEAGWWSNKVAQTTFLGSATSPAVGVGAGLDWMHGSTFFAAAEARWQHWISPPADLLLSRPEVVELGGTLRLTLAQDRLEIQGAGLWAWPFEEYLVRPDVRWRLSDPLAIGLGAVFLGGPSAPPKTLTEALTWSGGPFGYWDDNDCVFATLKWIQ